MHLHENRNVVKIMSKVHQTSGRTKAGAIVIDNTPSLGDKQRRFIVQIFGGGGGSVPLLSNVYVG